MSKLPVILWKQPNQDVDTDLLTDVAQQANCYGGVFAEEGVLKLNVFDNCDHTKIVAEMKQFNDLPVMLWFNNIESGMSVEHLQPMPLLFNKDDQGKNKDVLLAGAFVGAFTDFIRDGSAAPPTFYLGAELLIPKLQDMFEGCGSDISKLWAKLKQPYVEKEFKAQLGADGFIALMSSAGNIHTFRQSTDTPIIRPWGWTTDLLITPSVAQNTPATGLVRGSKAPAAPVPAPAPQAQPEPDKVNEDDLYNVTVDVNGKPFDYTSDQAPVIAGPPKNLTSKQKEKYYQKIAGHVPKTKDVCPPARIAKERWAKMRKDHNGGTTVNSLQEIKQVGVTTVIHAQQPAAPAKTDTDTKVPTPAEMQPVPPVIHPQMRDKIKHLLSEAAATPEKFQDPDTDAKHSTGFQQLGIGIEACFSWPRRLVLRAIATTDPHAASILWKNVIDTCKEQAGKITRLDKELADANEMLADLTDPNKVAEEEPAEEVAPAPVEQPKPAATKQQGGFAGMRRASKAA